MFTKILAGLVGGKEVNAIFVSAFAIDYTEDRSGIESVLYKKMGTPKRLPLLISYFLLARGLLKPFLQLV